MAFIVPAIEREGIVISVHNAAELSAAINAAVGGETIQLAPGDYGSVTIVKSFGSNVTITSADPNNQAHIDSLTVNAKNLSFSYLDIGGGLNGLPDYTPRADVENSTNISFDHVHVHGSLDSDPSNDGDGIHVLTSTNVTVTNSEFEQLRRALGFGDSHTGLYENNSFHDLRTHGIEVGGATDLTIRGNTFSDFYWQPGDHFDAIQLHNAGASFQTQNVTISDNVILQGDGMGVQGIFVRDDYGNMPYKNLTITNNLVYMSVWNGIYVENPDGMTVSGNSVLTPTNDGYDARIWISGGTGTTLANNVADVIAKDNSPGIVSETNDVALTVDPGFLSHFPNINLGAAATAAQLTTPGIGYQLPVPPQPAQAHESVSDVLSTALAAYFNHAHSSASVLKLIDTSAPVSKVAASTSAVASPADASTSVHTSGSVGGYEFPTHIAPAVHHFDHFIAPAIHHFDHFVAMV